MNVEEPVAYEGALHYFRASLTQLDPHQLVVGLHPGRADLIVVGTLRVVGDSCRAEGGPYTVQNNPFLFSWEPFPETDLFYCASCCYVAKPKWIRKGWCCNAPTPLPITLEVFQRFEERPENQKEEE